MRRLSIAFGTALTIGATVAWAVTQSTAERLIAQGSEGAAREPVVAELFTSEGCSSCPAADDVLTRLVVSQPIPGVEIIALGEHVDYWDRLGWRDPFSSAGYTARQSQYGSHVFRTGNIYTPQLVIDGQLETIGSDFSGIRKAALTAARHPKASVRLAFTDAPGSPGIDVRANISEQVVLRERADVLMAITEDGLFTNVRKGENGGRTLRHTAVVRSLSIIGAVSAEKRALTMTAPLLLSTDWKRENLRVVVMIQEPQSRRIVGAAAMSLPAQTATR